MIILSVLLLILLSIAPIFMLVFMFNSFRRINAFGKVVRDEISFYYHGHNFEKYVDDTEIDIIRFKLNRKKRNLDISASYKNLNLAKFWDWDFEKMLVDEEK